MDNHTRKEKHSQPCLSFLYPNITQQLSTLLRYTLLAKYKLPQIITVCLSENLIKGEQENLNEKTRRMYKRNVLLVNFRKSYSILYPNVTFMYRRSRLAHIGSYIASLASPW